MPPIPKKLKTLHPKTKALLARIRSGIKCIACNDTGKNSRGAPCHPCQQQGRIKA